MSDWDTWSNEAGGVGPSGGVMGGGGGGSLGRSRTFQPVASGQGSTRRSLAAPQGGGNQVCEDTHLTEFSPFLLIFSA